MWITFLNPLKDYVLSHFFNQTQQNAIKRNMYSYLTTDQKARSSNLLGRAKKARKFNNLRAFFCCYKIITLNGKSDVKRLTSSYQPNLCLENQAPSANV